MNSIQFENLLGKHISVAEAVTGYNFKDCNFNIENSDNKHYRIDSNSIEIREFYGMLYKILFIQTDKNDTVQSITVHFHKLIDRQFYESFNEVYGEPSSILVVEKRIVISEGYAEDDTNFNQYLRKSDLELREGSFDEGPLYIIWKREGYQAKALLRQQNMSDITFSLTDD